MKMRLGYSIDEFPEDPGGYNLTARTEGTLSVELGSQEFMRAKGILLVELAVALYKWLRVLDHTGAGFYYASMDFEEEPILAFRHDESNDGFVLESVWAKAEPSRVSAATARDAAHDYLKNLGRDLRTTYSVELEDTLLAAVADDDN